MEDVVQPLVATRPLNGDNIQRLLDDTDCRMIPTGVVTDMTGVTIRDIETSRAEGHFILQLSQRFGKLKDLFPGRS